VFILWSRSRKASSADIAARWNGTVLADIPPALPGGPALSLVVVDTNGVETDAFEGLQAQLSDSRGGVIELSSEEGLATLTIAAAEAAAGNMASINWLGRTLDYDDGLIFEDLSGPRDWSTLPRGFWSHNPYKTMRMTSFGAGSCSCAISGLEVQMNA